MPQRASGVGSCILAAVLLAGCQELPPGGGGDDPPIEITDWEALPAWSNAGDRITFASPGVGDSNHVLGLYVVDTNGNNLRLLSPGGAGSVWLPGDTALVFHKIDFNLYYLHLGAMEESLICDCLDARFPEMETTGNSLLYEDQGVSDNWATSVYRMNLLTGDTTHIVGGSYPSLSPDGRYLLVRRQGVFRYDLQSGSHVKVYPYGRMYDWSPDGGTILVDDFIERPLIGQVHKVNPDGSNGRYFTKGKHARYSPSGNRIALIRASSDGKDHVWLIDPDGSNAKQLTF